MKINVGAIIAAMFQVLATSWAVAKGFMLALKRLLTPSPLKSLKNAVILATGGFNGIFRRILHRIALLKTDLTLISWDVDTTSNEAEELQSHLFPAEINYLYAVECSKFRELEDGGAEGGNWDGLPPEVLDMIFQHLPVWDLLSCSVISRNWKRTARDVLKRSRECYAHIEYFDRGIQDLNEMIASTDIMQMINGLHIRYGRPKEAFRSNVLLWQDSTSCSDITRIRQSEIIRRNLENAKRKILGVLAGQWRHLDLDMECGHVLSLDEALLMREVFVATCDSLQKLVIGKRTDWKFIPCCGKSFAKLKVIQSQMIEDLMCCSEGSLSNFAPNLDKITGPMMSLDVYTPVNRFVLERLKNIKVPSKCDSLVPEREARELFRSVSNLHRLDLQSHLSNPYRGHDEQTLVEWNALVFQFEHSEGTLYVHSRFLRFVDKVRWVQIPDTSTAQLGYTLECIQDE